VIQMQGPVRHVLLVQGVHGGAHLSEELSRFAFRVHGQLIGNVLGEHEGVSETFLHETGLGVLLYMSRVVGRNNGEGGFEVAGQPKGVLGEFGTDVIVNVVAVGVVVGRLRDDFTAKINAWRR